MEFKIKQSVLKEALGAVAGCVDKTRTIPVLNNVLIESLGENSVRITATDLDVTIRRDAEAEIVKPGAICIEARRLIDITRNLSEGEMRFVKEKNDWVRMSAGKSKIRFTGRRRDEFPETVTFKSTPIRIACDVLHGLIQRTAFAVSNDMSRFTLQGVKFEVEDGTARMVATDRNRLPIAEGEIADNDANLSILIPKKALTEALRLDSETVAIGEDQNHIFFEIPGTLLVTRKLHGNFPNYQMVIPKNNDRVATFSVNDMLGAVKRASMMTDGESRSIVLDLLPGEIVITSKSDQGEVDERVETDYDGDPVRFGFQFPFVVDFLNVVSASERAVMSFKGSNDPAVLSVDDNFRYILMPQRLDVVETEKERRAAEKVAA